MLTAAEIGAIGEKTCNRLVKGKWFAVATPTRSCQEQRHRSYIRRSGDTRTGQDAVFPSCQRALPSMKKSNSCSRQV